MLRSLILLSALAVSPFAFAAGTVKWSPKVCDQRIEVMTKFYEHTKDRFNVGEVTRGDVAASELALAFAKYECGRTDVKEYCKVAVNAAEVQQQAIAEEAAIGQRTTIEVIEANYKLFLVKNECE